MHLAISLVWLSCFISASVTTPAPTPAPEFNLQKRACAGDNCLNALRNRISTAVPFCSTYTTDAAATIPTWATAQCASNPTRVTSACNCLATGTLTKVYGPTNDTKYTIFSQAVNIRSDPGPAPDEFFNNCLNMCTFLGSQCQTFSFVQMASDFDGSPGGLYLCYIYETRYQPALVEAAVNWTNNVVYQRS